MDAESEGDCSATSRGMASPEIKTQTRSSATRMQCVRVGCPRPCCPVVVLRLSKPSDRIESSVSDPLDLAAPVHGLDRGRLAVPDNSDLTIELAFCQFVFNDQLHL